VLGIAVALQRAGHAQQGAHLCVQSEIPIGAGLSSSAAIEVASALALISLNGVVVLLVESQARKDWLSLPSTGCDGVPKLARNECVVVSSQQQWLSPLPWVSPSKS
jgi:hypothetical protein